MFLKLDFLAIAMFKDVVWAKARVGDQETLSEVFLAVTDLQIFLAKNFLERKFLDDLVMLLYFLTLVIQEVIALQVHWLHSIEVRQ